jgi:hypothetical protein
MWAMLTARGTDLVIRHSNVGVDGATGHAHWDATYTFMFLTFPNHVENHIDATFELRDGRIVRHRDAFDLRRWMSQALSPIGGIISESTIKNGVRKELDAFMAAPPEFQEARPSAPPGMAWASPGCSDRPLLPRVRRRRGRAPRRGAGAGRTAPNSTSTGSAWMPRPSRPAVAA